MFKWAKTFKGQWHEVWHTCLTHFIQAAQVPLNSWCINQLKCLKLARGFLREISTRM